MKSKAMMSCRAAGIVTFLRTLFLFSMIFLVGACGPPTVSSLVSDNEPEKIAGGFGFTEGPTLDAMGRFHFTDIPGNSIYRWTEEEGLILITDATRWGNGLCFDASGNMLLCEMTSRCLSLVSPDGTLEVLTDSYDGAPYNSPNDVWVHPGGGVYFTDPGYFLEAEEKDVAIEAVYYMDPSYSKVVRVSEPMVRPNGVMGTPDGKILYVVSDSIHTTWKYAIQADGSLARKEKLIDNGHDGLTLDERGNLYIANRDSLSVDIYDRKGNFLESIYFPEAPANVCFGGKQRDILYATAQSSVYAVRMNVKGP
jgi:gluconolactonase